MQRPTVNRLKALIKVAPLGVALMWSVIQALPARAAEFAVFPMGVQFEPGKRSGTVGINNMDKRPIRFQLSLVEWTQDAQGKDIYTASDDLLFFPRQLTVKPGERGIARVGPKRPFTSPEKAYRLRVEELPDETAEGNDGKLVMTITFAVPLYLGSLDAKPAVVIAPIQMQKGQLTATVQNSGNAHFRIESLEVKGANGYAQQLPGWYLLAGANRQHVWNIPADVCKTPQRLSLTVKVGEHHFLSDVDIDPSMCATT
jgi:fimbrial chaperone protein